MSAETAKQTAAKVLSSPAPTSVCLVLFIVGIVAAWGSSVVIFPSLGAAICVAELLTSLRKRSTESENDQ